MPYKLIDIGNSILSIVTSMTVVDILDILIMTYVIYKGVNLVRETRAGQLVKGIILLAVIYFVSSELGFKVLTFIIKAVLDVGLLAVLIIFQPEIRRLLEKFGRTKVVTQSGIFGFGETNDEITQKWKDAINAICNACEELSATATGALIVIERETKLGEQIDTGTIMNAVPSKEIFGNIFYPKTPLHDGAVVMRDGIILAAACFLPKPQKEELINKKLGSRHRAAIGMSENSDAIIIVVSEETGTISIAENGVLTRDYNKEKLQNYLTGKLIHVPDDVKVNRKSKYKKKIKKNKKESGKEAE